MAQDDEEHAVDVAEIAAMLRVSADTVRRRAADVAVKEPGRGDIPGFRIGNRWRFFPSEVRAHLIKPVDPWAYLPNSRAKQRHRLT